jgi:hypothetical protein
VPGISINGKTGTQGKYLFPVQTYAIAESGPSIYLGSKSNTPSSNRKGEFTWGTLAEITDQDNLSYQGKPRTSLFWIADGCQTHHADEYREFLLSDDDSVHLIQMSNAPGDLNPDWNLPRLNVEVMQAFGGIVASFQDWKSTQGS